MIIEATQDGQVQARDQGHLLEIETASLLIKRVGNPEKDQKIETNLIEEENLLKETNMTTKEGDPLHQINTVAGREVTPKVTVGPVPSQTHVVIDMRKPLQGSPHQTASKREGMEDSLLYQGVIHVEEVGHRTETGLAANHVIELPLHSLAGMDPEDASNLSSAKKTPQGRVPILKDVRAILSNDVADPRIEMELLAARVDLPADQMSHGFARTAEVLAVVWHNAPYLRRMSFLIGAVNYVLQSCYTGPLLIINYLRIQGPPLQ